VESGEENSLCRVGWGIVAGILLFLVLQKILEISNPEINAAQKERDKRYTYICSIEHEQILKGLSHGNVFIFKPVLFE
jgi:hypothetical protein